ncbi:MAG: YccF domain-containing protein [Clostridia bacterium]|nr:YccF domain-containing protein [Clostridia bacterium]
MRLLGNILWFIFGGLITALLWCVAGLLLCITVVGIPFGTQFFKFAKLSLMPFGKNVNISFFKHPILNLLWFLILGWAMLIGYILAAFLCCITIVGIPVGIQALKFSKLAVAPFGAKVK